MSRRSLSGAWPLTTLFVGSLACAPSVNESNVVSCTQTDSCGSLWGDDRAAPADAFAGDDALGGSDDSPTGDDDVSNGDPMRSRGDRTVGDVGGGDTPTGDSLNGDPRVGDTSPHLCAGLQEGEACGLCATCQSGQCVLQLNGQDLNDECAATGCNSGQCDGNGACRPRLSGFVCRTDGAGANDPDCDVSETCDGNSLGCPSDQHEPNNIACGGECQKCNAGRCVNQTTSEDLFGDCGGGCETGLCNGSGSCTVLPPLDCADIHQMLCEVGPVEQTPKDALNYGAVELYYGDIGVGWVDQISTWDVATVPNCCGNASNEYLVRHRIGYDNGVGWATQPRACCNAESDCVREDGAVCDPGYTMSSSSGATAGLLCFFNGYLTCVQAIEASMQTDPLSSFDCCCNNTTGVCQWLHKASFSSYDTCQ